MAQDRQLVVFSGAGLSADSGISTFRSEDGTWNNHDVDQVCNIYRWKENFDLVHEFYNERRVDLASREPNPMHKLLADWQDRFGAKLVTQNIDDLLERAGATDVLHVHGKLTEMQCQACGRSWGIGTRGWDQSSERCVCNSKKGVKPNVVFFGERAPEYRPMFKLFESMSEDDVLVVIGTDGAVVPIGEIAAQLPCRKVLNTLEPVAEDKWRQGMVVPEQFDKTLYKPAATAVEELDALVSEWMGSPALSY